MYWLIGICVFIVFLGIYVYFRMSGRVQPETPRLDGDATNATKLFNSKVKDVAFFDGESEDYAETQSRIRQYGGA